MAVGAFCAGRLGRAAGRVGYGRLQIGYRHKVWEAVVCQRAEIKGAEYWEDDKATEGARAGRTRAERTRVESFVIMELCGLDPHSLDPRSFLELTRPRPRGPRGFA